MYYSDYSMLAISKHTLTMSHGRPIYSLTYDKTCRHREQLVSPYQPPHTHNTTEGERVTINTITTV